MLVAVNGMRVTGHQLDDGREALQVLQDETNYPINLKFARPRLTTNEKIFQVGQYLQIGFRASTWLRRIVLNVTQYPCPQLKLPSFLGRLLCSTHCMP